MSAGTLVLLALLAQGAEMSPSPRAKARAQFLLSEGAQLYERGATAAALDKFQRAYAEFPSPKLLFNIGQCNRDLGRSVDAMNAFERFVSDSVDAPVAMMAEAKRSMAELRNSVGSLTIKCGVRGANIGVDGKSVGSSPLLGSLWVMPGTHLVTARHPKATQIGRAHV